MNARAWKRLEQLVERCAEALRNPAQQSIDVWRGDMWAVIGAHHDAKKLREKKPSKAGR